VSVSTSANILAGVLFRHWPAKIGALVLAAVLFVFTRDEVTRAFEVPLRVVPDDERVLLTKLPDTVQVQVRGPWTRVNRLQEYDFGGATFDLRAARPGPLEIDRASIVMPAGVVLAGIQYDHVDLRFEPIVQRAIEVVPSIVGKPAADHRLVRVETEPASWEVRGGRSQVDGLTQIATEPLDIGGAVQTIEAQVGLVPPATNARLVEPRTGAARVRVRALVEPTNEERDVTVRIPEGALVAGLGLIDESYRVRVSGPMPAFRVLEEAEIDEPVTASVEQLEIEGAALVQVRFEWSERVPLGVRDQLRLDRGVVRVPVRSAEAGADD
jgi:YbbR domain-containing protein